ncbi:hypothetical protein N9891_01310 [bacterium]|nr:hypothetical protein [bacterium]
MGTGDSIQLNLDAAGNGVADYSITAETIGTAQSIPSDPELAGLITKIGFVDADTVFIEFAGSGSMNVTESSDLINFTQVTERTAVSSPSQNRLAFTIPAGASRMFFRIDEG